jgi:hypothetical protein
MILLGARQIECRGARLSPTAQTRDISLTVLLFLQVSPRSCGGLSMAVAAQAPGGRNRTYSTNEQHRRTGYIGGRLPARPISDRF